MRTERGIYAFALLASAGAAALVAVLVQRWTGPLAGYGDALPASARAALAVAPWMFALPLIVLAGWFVRPAGRRHRVVPAVVGLLALLAAAVLVMALYLPLFKLAAVIG